MAADVSAAQIRAARAMLDWSMSDLADAARVSVASVKRAQDGTGPQPVDRAVVAIRSALEAGGVRFLADDGHGSGVRLRTS